MSKTATNQKVTETLKKADKRWGFRFGCDGTCSRRFAADFIGVSLSTLDRKLSSGVLRKGKDPHTGHTLVCKKSISVYMEKLEV